MTLNGGNKIPNRQPKLRRSEYGNKMNALLTAKRSQNKRVRNHKYKRNVILYSWVNGRTKKNVYTKVHWNTVNTKTMVDRSAKAKSANRTQYKGMVNRLDQNNTRCTLWYTSKP